MSWEGLEQLYESYGPAAVSSRRRLARTRCRSIAATARSARPPVIPGRRSSRSSIALASVKSHHGELGTKLEMEHTVEYERRKVDATVVDLPFFNPERKRKP